MWWPESSPPATYEAAGLVLGLVPLFAVGIWWRWVCDTIDAYPEAFWMADKRTSRTDRELHEGDPPF